MYYTQTRTKLGVTVAIGLDDILPVLCVISVKITVFFSRLDKQIRRPW